MKKEAGLGKAAFAVRVTVKIEGPPGRPFELSRK